MRYLLLILLLAGGYYGWDYYQNGLAPRHEALKAMEQEPCPELDAAQARFDEAAELHEQQAVRLQQVHDALHGLAVTQHMAGDGEPLIQCQHLSRDLARRQ